MKTSSLPISELSADIRGFTLVELMVAMVMALIMISATFGIVNHSSRIYRAQERISDSQQDVRAALGLLARDIRIAGYDPLRDAGGPIAGIVTATVNTFQYTADTNASGTIDQADNERVTYTYNAATQTLSQILYEGTASQSTATVIDKVTAMTFTYLNSAGNVTATPADIRRVVVSITCQNRDDQGGTFSRTLTTDINCRNLSLG